MTRQSIENFTPRAGTEPYSPARQASAYKDLIPVYESRHDLLQPVRHIVLKRVLSDLDPGSTVLEVGCGCGASLALIAAQGFKAEGLDFSPEMVAAAHKHSSCPVACVDFTTHAFKEQQYDLVFAQAFVHLFPKHTVKDIIKKLLALARRRVFFSTTINELPSEGWEPKDGVLRYRSRFTRVELHELIAGVTINCGWRAEAFELKDPLEKLWLDVILTRPS
jgi:2-polyprenyl-3-methyl-5-hydroxy-6-metoxy-1,4-benzoquinol methylase